ncbi:zinc metallopeptidase [Companilactobacillus metriopterae]|uniref:zinc metallopeptidase n=1 Tax=Companilactobacillus metriopterae TaxID=1909267 RepID=UPI00100A2AE5|nr:zinc metallopeptidase [Companilactobacillus metriopterae]
MGYYGFGFFDPTYILVIIGIVISLWASIYVRTTFNKYDKFKSKQNISGAEAARYILDNAGLQDVEINEIAGELTDNYNPRDKTLNLSQSTHDSTSVAAIGVAAHECGHAIQDQKNYIPMRLRSFLVPAVNIGSTVSIPLIFIGILFSMNMTLITVGIWLFAIVVLFQVVTLPVEFNASGRAVRILGSSSLIDNEEVSQVKKVLTAAALTYVAAALSSILQLLRLVLLFNNRD